MKILIIDDEPGYCVTIKDALAYKASLCHSSTQAIKALEMFASALNYGDPYDLVIVDYRMPEINGVNFIKKIREYEAFKGGWCCKVIMVTAYTKPYMESLQAGADEYIEKPFKIEELRKAVYG